MAWADLGEAIGRAPGSAEAYLARGGILDMLERNEESRRTEERLEVLLQEVPRVWILKGQMEWRGDALKILKLDLDP